MFKLIFSSSLFTQNVAVNFLRFFFFVKIDEFVYRAVIKFFVLDELTPKKIYQKLTKIYEDSVSSMLIIKKLAADFKRDCTSLCDDFREERPKTAIKLENIVKVFDVMLDDRRVKMNGIIKAVVISEEKVRNILHKGLRVQKLHVRLVPHLLHND